MLQRMVHHGRMASVLGIAMYQFAANVITLPASEVASGAVYCNRSCLLCVCVCLRTGLLQR